MERYRNKRVIHRKAGRFAKAPTLQELGYDVSDGALKTCKHCGSQRRPISNTGWLCGKCGQRN